MELALAGKKVQTVDLIPQKCTGKYSWWNKNKGFWMDMSCCYYQHLLENTGMGIVIFLFKFIWYLTFRLVTWFSLALVGEINIWCIRDLKKSKTNSREKKVLDFCSPLKMHYPNWTWIIPRLLLISRNDNYSIPPASPAPATAANLISRPALSQF